MVRAVLSDDGDHDGWADTRETVSMRLAVRNLTGIDLTGLVFLVSTDNPAIAGITDNRAVFGDLADGEMRLSDEVFEFVVGDVDRTDAAQSLSVRFRFRSYADQYDLDGLKSSPCPSTVLGSLAGVECGLPAELTLDLDLDASGGGAATTFFEGFESGFGQFTTMHLDEALNPPPGDINNHALGVVAADGWRCQYSDPDWEKSRSYNRAAGLVCYPSQNGVTDTYYWHIANERAFSGEQSLHYGVLLDLAALYSTPQAQLEAIRTTNPVNLSWANVCSVTRTTFCSTAIDCPAGEACEPSAPRFTFKHQISMIDGRAINTGPGTSSQMSGDRGIVSVQLASSSDGSALGPWVRLEPYVNLYDTQANTNYFDCTFDPADDGNTEEDFFIPTDPLRAVGPSSMCYPHYNFTFQGSTVLHDTARLGKASDGPGLLGSEGPGTWVEPAFDLSRFRGHRLRLRFVATGVKAGAAPLWHPFINNTAANPDPRDDGWFIDDVRVTDVLTAPASWGPDAKDNGALPGLDDPDADAVPFDNCPFAHNPDQADADGDANGDVCDVCPIDPYDDRYGASVCCPAFPGDDADGDGLCGVLDSCPTRFNTVWGAAYSVATLPTARPFAGNQLSVDGQQYVYIDSGNLYSVALTGGSPTLLQGKPTPEHGGVTFLGQTPDGTTIVFRADLQVPGQYELYTVPSTGGAAQRISAPLQPGGDVVDFLVAPDSTRVVYRANQWDLYSVGIDGSTVVKLNAPGQLVEQGFQISPDGTTVVYRGGEKLWAVPIVGGTPVNVTGTVVIPSYVPFVISGDSTHVVYLRDVDHLVFELYAVPIEGGAEQKLNGPLAPGGDVVNGFTTTPDGSQVLYIADEDVDGVFELYRVGIDGTGRTRLTPGVSLSTMRITADGSRVVAIERRFTSTVFGTLYSVELAGGAVEPLASCVTAFKISPDSSTVAYAGDCNASSSGIHSIPTTGGAATFLAGASMWSGRAPVAFTPDSATLLFSSSIDEATTGVFVVPLAAENDDGDGLTFPCDCDPTSDAVYLGAPEINDGQDNECPGDPGFGLADDLGMAVFDAAHVFAWPAQPGATAYEVARSATPDFATGCATVVTADPWWADAEEPLPGSAFFYLARALAPNAGSWGADSSGVERGPICPGGP